MSARIRASVRALEAYTPGEQPRDPGLLKLNTNENPYPPSPRAVEALRAFDANRLRLYPDPVCAELRAAIGRLHGCEPGRVFVGNGSDEVLTLCVRAYVEPDGAVGFFDPSYSLYPVLAAAADVATRPVALADDFGWAMPPDYRASLFFLTRPNAPTGVAYPRETVEAFCARFPGVVVIDEAYVDFAPDSMMDLALKLKNTLVLRTLSKSFALAGLRVGYAVGDPELIGALYKLKDSYNVDALAQAIARAAIEDAGYMRAQAARITATRARVAEALGARGFVVTPSAANFLWVLPPAPGAEAWFAALRARKTLVRYFPGPRTGAHLRVTIGSEAEMERFLDDVDAIAKGA